MIPEMEMIADCGRDEFYSVVEHVQSRIHFYNQQNSQRINRLSEPDE